MLGHNRENPNQLTDLLHLCGEIASGSSPADKSHSFQHNWEIKGRGWTGAPPKDPWLGQLCLCQVQLHSSMILDLIA